MAKLNEKESREFVAHIIGTLEVQAPALTAAGFDPAVRISQLLEKSNLAAAMEVAQQEAEAAALKATAVSNEALSAAYKDASAAVDLIEGLLGKDHELVRLLRQYRKK